MEQSPNNGQSWEEIMAKQRADGPLLFTMRQLSEHTADVIRTMNETNRAALITRMGRFVTAMQPLANIENLEGTLIARAVEAGDIDPTASPDRIYSAEEILAEIDFNQ